MSEKELEDAVLAIAKTLGYRCFHPLTAIREQKGVGKRYMTAYQGDRGFPDWVYARKGKVLFVEYKKEGRYPDPDQRAWLAELGPLARLWRPSNLSSGEILETLTSL